MRTRIKSKLFGNVIIPDDVEWGLLPEEDVSFPVCEYLRVRIYMEYGDERTPLRYIISPCLDDNKHLESGKL